MRYAIQIDAGYLRARFITGRLGVFDACAVRRFVDVVSAAPELCEHDLYRVYFYDATPLGGSKPKPLCNGTEKIDFSSSESFDINSKLHAELESVDFVALRMGKTAFRGWAIKKGKMASILQSRGPSVNLVTGDFQPVVSQKGVDLRVGLDIAALALKRHVDIVVLVTGDSDFVPALKFARREGLQTYLVQIDGASVPQGQTSRELAQHIDKNVRIAAADLHG
ncbi:MAG: NYN domain-containing protein [Burkholderiaceae bacterium]|nr:NYN domain-containing protein [Burkholderiaceae bacterium]